MGKTVIVIGAGQTAASFAARLLQNDSESQITLIGEEAYLPYQRPPLSKKYATGEITTEQLLLRPSDWYEQNNITCITDTKIISIDADAKTLSTKKGEAFNWDKLVFATGSRARHLPEQIGGNLEGIYVLRSLEDADTIAEKFKTEKNVVIVGGGYIGLEAAAVCAKLGLSVTLIEAADRILQRVACKETSDWFRTLHEGYGVKIIEGTGLEKLEETDGNVSAVLLTDGTRLETSFVLAGIGIIPNAELASGIGLDVDGGIIVNAHCQTSNPDIYAAGDCAAFDFKGERTRLESVQNAIDQADCAADNIAGKTHAYAPYPWFWSDQYDVKLQIAGLNRGYDNVIVRPGEREGGVSHFYYTGDTLLAVDAINDPRTYMVAKKMLEAGKNIMPEQAADTDLQLKTLLK